MIMGLDRLNAVVKELCATNKTNDKIVILSKYADDKEICKYFNYAYNPFYTYGVTSKNLIKNNNLSELEFFNNFFELLDLLRTRKVTGNKAISLVNGYINQNYIYEDLLYKFFDRNLEIGMGVTQINKALNNVIPVFDVALAGIFEESKKEKYKLEDYCIQHKLNGLRLVVIITHDKQSNTTSVKSYSRKGKEFTTCKRIEDELLAYYNKSKYFGQDLVFDGEVCIIDELGKEDWNRAVSEAKKKNYTMEHPRYTIFDFLTLEEFSGQKISRDYTFRRDNLFRNFFGLNHPEFQYLSIIFATPYTESRFNRLMKEYVETDKWEGLILRKMNVPYKAGRGTDLLKVKLFKDAEYIVTDVVYTEKPMLNKDGKMEMTKCVGALTFNLENGNECKVGTGISDTQRIEWYKNPNLIIGKQIQVKYKEKTKVLNANNVEVWSLQFPVLTHIFDEKRDF